MATIPFKFKSEKFSFTGFDTSNLTAYVKEKGKELLTKSLFTGKTASIFPIQEGIKHKEMMNFMDLGVNFRTLTDCATESTGEVTFTQKEITVGKIYDMIDFCPAQLENFFTQEYLPAGSTYQDMPLEAAFIEHYTGEINEAIETMLWQETVKFTGFNATIDATSGVINGNSTSIPVGTGITTSNVIGIFNEMVDLLPPALAGKSGVEFVCGWDTYRKLLQAHYNSNNYFHNGATASPYETGEFISPIWGIKVTALHGLTGTNRIHLSRLTNYRIGTDMKADFENGIETWYEAKESKIYVRVKGKLGTQIEFGNELVTFKLVP